jgi:hypothetical protein
MNDHDDFDWSQMGPTPAHYELARGMLDDGLPFSEIRMKLTRQGLKPEFAETVVMDLARKLIAPLVIAGSNREVIQQRLLRHGLTDEETTAVCETIAKKHIRAVRASGLRTDRLYKAGCIFLMAGGAVWLGAMLGLFPADASLLGYFLIGVGAILSGLPLWHRWILQR